MEQEEFEQLVKEGIDAIPEKFLKKLKNVEICVQDDPTPQQLQRLGLRGALLFGLYEGIPQTRREVYGQVLPDKITIFKNPIEKCAFSKEAIKKTIQHTVWHEVAHHFGMDEQRVRKAEKKRNG